jgi:hypothetical protein
MASHFKFYRLGIHNRAKRALLVVESLLVVSVWLIKMLKFFCTADYYSKPKNYILTSAPLIEQYSGDTSSSTS